MKWDTRGMLKHLLIHNMSDTENKKPSKGGEHTGSKKRAAAAAAAAVAAVAAGSDATPADDIDDTANCLPKHKRSKHERNTAETQPDLAAVGTITTTEDANDEDEEISDQRDEASDATHKPVDVEENVKGTPSTAAPMDVVAERAVATGTVLTICAAARKLVNNVASSAKGPRVVLDRQARLVLHRSGGPRPADPPGIGGVPRRGRALSAEHHGGGERAVGVGH